MRTIILAALTAALVALTVTLTTAAHAQGPHCAPTDVVLEGLSNRYNETPVMKMDGTGGRYLLVFVSGDRGGWTVLDVHPNGIACQVAAGDGWERFEAPLPGQPT